MPSSSDPTEPLRAHFQKERQSLDRHPSPERIAAYHERRLGPEEAEEIREHLAACPDCTAQLLAFASLSGEDEEPGPEMSQAELDAAWERQRARLFPSPPAVLAERRKPPVSSRWAWATAATMGLAAALLTVVVIDQRQALEELARPRVNPPLVNLVPSGSMRQGVQDVPEIRLSEEPGWALVILNPDELEFSLYDVEVFGPKGERVLLLKNQPISEAGNFRLAIPQADLATPGDYKILLLGKKNGQRQKTVDFALRVR
ncbi:MAG TPA: zf-HC2 domain-containing protein [Thermoanaerobaculia bacterium]|nr:zf-HC2 domain-containing protein [Thermoanaerobaculia bacterium]